MSDSETPADALSVLGDETRIAILRALAEAEGPLTFTDLRERVGIRDTGRFNYHLTKLCEHFVRDTRDGYELGHAGSRVIAAAGVETEAVVEPQASDPDGECPVCGDEDCEKLYHVHLEKPWG